MNWYIRCQRLSLDIWGHKWKKAQRGSASRHEAALFLLDCLKLNLTHQSKLFGEIRQRIYSIFFKLNTCNAVFLHNNRWIKLKGGGYKLSINIISLRFLTHIYCIPKMNLCVRIKKSCMRVLWSICRVILYSKSRVIASVSRQRTIF